MGDAKAKQKGLPRARKAPRGIPAMSTRDRFNKLRVFTQAGQRLLNTGPCGNAVAVWFTLWNYEDAETRTVTIGKERLAGVMGLNARTVQRGLKALRELGFLKVLAEPIAAKCQATVYQLFAYPPEQVGELPAKYRAAVTTPVQNGPEPRADLSHTQGVFTYVNTPPAGGVSPPPPLGASGAATPALAPVDIKEFLRSHLRRTPIGAGQLHVDLASRDFDINWTDLQSLPYLRFFRATDGTSKVTFVEPPKLGSRDRDEWAAYLLNRNGKGRERRLPWTTLKGMLVRQGFDVTDEDVAGMPTVEVFPDPDSISQEMLAQLARPDRTSAA